VASKLAQLSEQNLSDWAKMELPQQLELYRTKIEVEIDGQRRLRKQVKQSGNVEELAEVDGSLEELRHRLAAVKEAIRNPEAARQKMPEWWDPTQPPRLFWKPRLPRTGGRWGVDGKDPPGNSRWYSDNPLVQKITGGKGILFRNRYPVFSNPKWSAGSVQIEMSGMADDFSAADKMWAKANGWLKPNGEPNISASAQWRKDNGYTWHHHQSGKTMILVLTDLHANVPHSGGACLARGVE
jgi:hypothetical protein